MGGLDDASGDGTDHAGVVAGQEQEGGQHADGWQEHLALRQPHRPHGGRPCLHQRRRARHRHHPRAPERVPAPHEHSGLCLPAQLHAVLLRAAVGRQLDDGSLVNKCPALL